VAAGEGEPFDARLLNISEGGVGFHLKRSTKIGLKINDFLRLLVIFGHPHLNTITELSMEVRWIMDEDYLDHVAVGCEFINLDDHNREQIQDFVLIALAEHKQQQREVL
jgi:c-di-GMP-binding flagellar brake protein YcgR